MSWCGGMSNGGRKGSAGTRSNGDCHGLVLQLVVVTVVVMVLETVVAAIIWW